MRQRRTMAFKCRCLNESVSAYSETRQSRICRLYNKRICRLQPRLQLRIWIICRLYNQLIMESARRLVNFAILSGPQHFGKDSRHQRTQLITLKLIRFPLGSSVQSVLLSARYGSTCNFIFPQNEVPISLILRVHHLCTQKYHRNEFEPHFCRSKFVLWLAVQRIAFPQFHQSKWKD